MDSPTYPQRARSPHSNRPRRPILTIRRPGVEKLISDIPGCDSDRAQVRRYAENLIGFANEWARNKLASRGRDQ